jgi:hypothetical protein
MGQPAPEYLFRAAVVARHLDSLATVVLRRRLYEAEGRTDRAAEYARRANFYAADIERVLERLDAPPQAAAHIHELTRAARSERVQEGGDR